MTGESIGESRCQSFFPIDVKWQEAAARIFGRAQPQVCHYATVDKPIKMPHRRPKRTKNPVGDGACFPRSISLAVFGHQRHHQKIRDQLVDFILKGPLPFETAVRDEAFYLYMKIMRERTEYMTTFEVEALSYMLQTPIYSCVLEQRTDGSDGRFFWQRSPHESSPQQVVHDRGIYIQNSHDHFQLVTEF